ncbi:MAG TPA: hypothetical protein VEC36_10480 [Patescibacteria group bacterium]|nr:hypothetical protein [Patescibacteria group bacterium]
MNSITMDAVLKMNYLHEFINILKGDELEKVQSLQLPLRQRNVLHTILNFRHRELPEVPELLKALDMSSQHFYKINSVLLNKCYAAFAPELGLRVLEILTAKNLYRHFCHEMFLQEKQLLKNAPDQLEEFYFRCFNLLQAQSAKYYEEPLTCSFGEKYLAARKNPQKDDELYVEVRLLQTRIIMLSVRGKNDELGCKMLNELERHAEALHGSRHAPALYGHYHGFAAYYTYFTDADENAGKILDYLLKARSICEEYPHILGTSYQLWTQGKIAEAHYAAGNFQQAYENYTELFKTDIRERQKWFYHATKFTQICIILGELAKAGELLHEYFDVHVASREKTMTTMGSISYAKLHLAKGELLKAKEYIDLGFELNTKNYYVQYEIELRNLQNTYFFLKEEWELAEDLARRNLKFLTSKGFTLETSTYGYFYKMILAFINTRMHKEKFPESLEPKYELYQKSYYAVYGKLLKIMWEVANSKV